MPNGNLGVHLSPFSFPPLVVLASRKCTRSAFWCSNESVSRAWIKLFCCNNALRQWRRGNMSQLGVDCLNLVQHLQLRCLEDRFLPVQRTKKGTAKHSHLSTSFLTFRQSKLYLMAYIATVRPPSNLHLLLPYHTHRFPRTSLVRAFKHRLHDSLVGCSSIFARKVLGDRDWLRTQ